MKKIRKFPRITTHLLIAACISGASFSVVPALGQGSDTKEKIRLMSAALRSRDAGDLNDAKASLEELIRIAPDDPNVARMLDSVNKDIDRKASGQTTVYGGAANISEFDPVQISKGPASVSLASGDLDAILEAEVANQEAFVKQAKMTIKDAKKLAASDRYEEAINLLNEARGLITESSATEGILSDLDATIGDIIIDQGVKACKKNDLETANGFLALYKQEVGEDRGYDALAQVIRETRDNPWNQNVDELSPGFLDRQAVVDQLLVKGRAQILYGDLEGATQTLREIEARDAYNAAAKALQLEVADMRRAAADLDRLKTRELMMQEVSRNWQRPQVFELEAEVDGPGPETTTLEILQNIIVPSFRVSDVSLADVINTLSEISVDYDPEGKGVNMVSVITPGENPRITISLRGLSLHDILNFVTDQVDYGWEVRSGVVSVEKTGNDVFLDTQFFPINRGTVIRITGFSGGDDSAAASADPFAPAPAPSAGPSGTEQEDALKNFFERAGIPFVPPASLAFDGTQLIVTQTARNLEKLRNILRRYDETKQVEIETKFLEVNQGALDELGFTWSATNSSGSKTLSTNNRSLAGAFTIDADSSNLSITSPPVASTDFFGNATVSPGIERNLPLLPPQIPSTLVLGAGATNAANITGVLNKFDVNVVVNALQQTTGSDLMSSPRVTVLSGRTANIVVAQELIYPENYGDIEAEVDSGGAGTDFAGGGSVAITTGTPQDFTMRPVGVEMNVTPEVEENQNISMKLSPRVTEFEGFVEYGGPSVAIAGGTTVTVPAGFYQPIFSTREVTTEVTIFDGATVVIGGLTREEVKTVKDKVPVLGDIPLLGRLFRSEGESSAKRNLLIFVTANMISGGGSPVQQISDSIQPDALFQNPLVVTPGGGVSRKVAE